MLDSVDQHRTALIRNLERAIKRNDYGAITDDRTDEALDEFFASIDLDEGSIPYPEAQSLVLEQLDFRRNEDRSKGFDASSVPIDGHAFERWVAEALDQFGWDAHVTPASGDQGIDVIARKGDLHIGIQCKLYSSAVGNKAIQEAHSGKVFHNLTHVAVLSNAEFTNSARDLARATGVLLVSHHDIPDLEAKIIG